MDLATSLMVQGYGAGANQNQRAYRKSIIHSGRYGGHPASVGCRRRRERRPGPQTCHTAASAWLRGR
jgi:hypothetical protein